MVWRTFPLMPQGDPMVLFTGCSRTPQHRRRVSVYHYDGLPTRGDPAARSVDWGVPMTTFRSVASRAGRLRRPSNRGDRAVVRAAVWNHTVLPLVNRPGSTGGSVLTRRLSYGPTEEV